MQSKGLSRVFSNTRIQNPWLIHVNVWQKPLQYCKIICLQLIKINGKKKTSIFQHSAFFIVQFSHPYMTTGKTTALTRWTFVGKVVSLLFNMLSRLVIGHSFSSKEQASFNFMAAVTICSDFGTPKIMSVAVSIFSPSICHEVIGL